MPVKILFSRAFSCIVALFMLSDQCHLTLVDHIIPLRLSNNDQVIVCTHILWRAMEGTIPALGLVIRPEYLLAPAVEHAELYQLLEVQYRAEHIIDTIAIGRKGRRNAITLEVKPYIHKRRVKA